jgi:hypothetical protein
MSRKLAIFSNQEKAIKSIEALQQQGFAPTEITVLAKDREHSRRIESETAVHVDELMDIAKTVQDHEQHSGTFIVGSMGATTGSSPALGAYPAVGVIKYDDMDFSTALESALDGFELDSKQQETCNEAIQGGAIAVIVETDESKSDAGSGISRLDTAEASFRSHGAQQIL